ncbi:uncharacterized protein LOC143365943 [Andrena cerasifolii]|uniref:uncharacterized protein LOC143365943 n=1 Tax=Andrena cerasifolii TaxID=2819439 RepID=UPI004037BEBE
MATEGWNDGLGFTTKPTCFKTVEKYTYKFFPGWNDGLGFTTKPTCLKAVEKYTYKFFPGWNDGLGFTIKPTCFSRWCQQLLVSSANVDRRRDNGPSFIDGELFRVSSDRFVTRGFGAIHAPLRVFKILLGAIAVWKLLCGS